MTQNAILNKWKFKSILGEHGNAPTIDKYWILKLHDSTQNLFSPPSSSTECLQTPLTCDIHTYIHACIHMIRYCSKTASHLFTCVCVLCVCMCACACVCVRACACMSVCGFCEFKHFSTLCLKVAILKHRVPKCLNLCKLHYIVWLTYALHTQVNHERVVVLSFKQHHACTHIYVHT